MSESTILNKLVDNILDGDVVNAKETFEDAISLKIVNALDQKKIDLAQQMYSPSEEEEVEEVEEYSEEETEYSNE